MPACLRVWRPARELACPSSVTTVGLDQNAIAGIVQGQREWAERADIVVDRANRCPSVEANLFRGIGPETRAEFAAGAGEELGNQAVLGSMSSLRSSSALAVNVFEPWRGHDLSVLSSAFGDATYTSLRFEARFPTGLGGTPPHLDVLLSGSSTIPLGIECKFAEIYTPPSNVFRESYFARDGLWDGLPSTRKMAERLTNGGLRFEHLGAAQLIKHALGLKAAFEVNGFSLLYLWFAWPCAETERHLREVEAFTDAIDGEFGFTSMTYQELFGKLVSLPEPQSGYLEYLRDRYFAR